MLVARRAFPSKQGAGRRRPEGAMESGTAPPFTATFLCENISTVAKAGRREYGVE